MKSKKARRIAELFCVGLVTTKVRSLKGSIYTKGGLAGEHIGSQHLQLLPSHPSERENFCSDSVAFSHLARGYAEILFEFFSEIRCRAEAEGVADMLNRFICFNQHFLCAIK